MATRRRARTVGADEALFTTKKRARVVPFAFVLDELASLDPITKPMFGCTAVYVDDRIVFILRKREKNPRDDGVWIATTREHHESLRKELPCMRSIEVFGDSTGWQNLPADDADFEDAVLRACMLVRRRDPRIGKVPKARKSRAKK